MSDNIIKPKHYTQGNIETIDIIKAMTGEGFESYCVGNIIKYVDRYKHKNGIEDLQKAKAYIDFIIKEYKQPELKCPPKPKEAKWDDIEFVDPVTHKVKKLGLG